MTDAGGDRIELRGIRAVGVCGALPEEQDRRQPFEVDLDVHLDLTRPAHTDRLEDTADYGALGQLVVDLVEGERLILLERLAQLIADAVLAHDRVRSVTVTVRKLRPPVPYEMRTSAVTIERSRPSR